MIWELTSETGIRHSLFLAVAPRGTVRNLTRAVAGQQRGDTPLDRWINSSERRKNPLLSKATRVGIASAKDAGGNRTCWTMEIACDCEPEPLKGKGGRMIADAEKQGPLVKREIVMEKRGVVACTKRKSGDRHFKLLSLCL
jgi:hypothetical protein